MKRRIIDKYINRYIYPVIKNLPVTSYGHFLVDENGCSKVIGKNHTIINGEIIPEGSRHNGCQNILRNIRLTGLKAKEIVENHSETHLRMINVKGNHIRMRLITE